MVKRGIKRQSTFLNNRFSSDSFSFISVDVRGDSTEEEVDENGHIVDECGERGKERLSEVGSSEVDESRERRRASRGTARITENAQR